MNRLKELRIANRYSQKFMAQKFNVSETTISHWETGDREMSYDMLIKFAQFYNVSIDYLLGNDSKIKVEEIQTDPFQVAFYGETKDLSFEDKEKIIEYAKWLKFVKDKKS